MNAAPGLMEPYLIEIRIVKLMVGAVKAEHENGREQYIKEALELAGWLVENDIC